MFVIRPNIYNRDIIWSVIYYQERKHKQVLSNGLNNINNIMDEFKVRKGTYIRSRSSINRKSLTKDLKGLKKRRVYIVLI